MTTRPNATETQAPAQATLKQQLEAAYAAGREAAQTVARPDLIIGEAAAVAAILEALPDESIIRNGWDGTAYEAGTPPIGKRRRYWTPVGDSVADTSIYLAENIPAGFGFEVLHRAPTALTTVDADRQAGYL